MPVPSSVSGSGRAPTPQLDVTPGHDIDRTWPDIAVPFPDGVTMTPAIHYAVPPGCRPLTLDLYRPRADTPRPAAGFPMIMFIHGGGWTRGDTRASRPLRRFPWVLAAIAARGYIVTSIDYRMTGEALWPAQGQDVKAAIRFLRKHAVRFGIDPNRFASWGVSCGGHLSAVLAATAGEAGLSPSYDASLADVSDAVQAAVSWYGGFNMETIAAQSDQVGAISRKDGHAPEWAVLGGTLDKVDLAYARTAGPINYVHADMPPMLFCVGDQDKIIPYLQTIEMVDRMKAVGARVELEVVPGANHDFAYENVAETRSANQHVMDLTLRFLDRILHGS